MLLGAGHGDVEKVSLLPDLIGDSSRHVGRNAAVNYIEDEDGIPLLALRRVDGRKHKLVLVEDRVARRDPSRLGRVEGQFR
jgi:hypothetical protein